VVSSGNSLAIAAGDTLAFQLSGRNVRANTGAVITLATGIHCM
jgi:hypothetical protein